MKIHFTNPIPESIYQVLQAAQLPQSLLEDMQQAFFSSDASLVIPKDHTVEKPIYFVGSDQKSQIEIEANAKAMIIEIFCDTGHRNLNINLGKKASLTHILIQKGHPESVQCSEYQIMQAEGSQYNNTFIAFGGKSNQINTHLHLNESYATSEYNALTLGNQKENIELALTVLHKKPNVKSHTVSRTVMDKQAKGRFFGKLIIEAGANKAIANLENKNLLLSKEAEANTTPQLEIYHDDVQCTHGATVGHLEEEALFYLRSRGISEVDARLMLIDGFIQPALKLLQGSSNNLFNILIGLIHAHSR